MAGVDYQVNIKLNAKPLDDQLKTLEKRVNDLKKNLAAPLRTEERAAKQAAASAEKRARLEDRAAAAQVTRVNLGQRLNRLEEKGINVSKGRTIINRSLKAYEEGRIQTARAQNSLARTYITQLERQLKVGVKTGRMQAENIDALAKAQVKRYTLDQQIRRLEEAGVNTAKLRAKLGEVTTAQARRQFGSFKQLTGELSLAIRKERDKLALQQRQTRELQQQSRMRGAASPIGGATFIPGSPAQIAASARTGGARSSIRGDINIPGSPAFIEAQQAELIRLGRIGGARSAVDGSVDIPGSPAFIRAQARERQKAMREAAAGGIRLRRLATSANPLISRLEGLTAPAGQLALPSSRMLGAEARGIQRITTLNEKVTREKQEQLALENRIQQGQSRRANKIKQILQYEEDINAVRARFLAGDPSAYRQPIGPAPAFSGIAPSSPIGGAPNIPGSPAFLRRQRRIQQASGVALGAGFPLLFGGGPGSILGGAVGGLVPGPAGFAAQIGLSALGQQFDRIGAAAINLGKALDPLGFDLKTVAGATGIAGTKTEEFLAKIEEFGGKAAAAAEASKLMASRIGKDATDALTKFGKDAQIVGNQISIIFTKVLAAIAAAAGPLLSALGSGLTRINQLGGFKERAGLTGADLTAQKFLTRTGRLTPGQRRSFAAGLGLKATATAGQIRKAAEARALTSQQTFETQQATALEQQALRLEAEAETAKQPKQGKKDDRRSRLPDLQAEEKKLQDLLRLDREMFEFRRNDDALGVRRLEHQMRLVEFAEEKAKVQASDVPNAEKLQSIANIDLEIKREELQLAYDIDEINKKASQRAFEEMQNKIKQQNQLNKGLQQQLQLADQISNVLGQGMTQSFELLITGAENWGMALRDIAANVLRDIARQLIQIYVIEQAVSFMRTLFSATSLTAPGGRYEGQAGALAAKPPPLPPLPGKALGGAVSSGKPYMVGERGPELFVPGASGNIVPNHSMGGVQVGSINITVENKGDQLSPEAQKRLANQVQGIVMSTLVNQKRSGGML